MAATTRTCAKNMVDLIFTNNFTATTRSSYKIKVTHAVSSRPHLRLKGRSARFHHRERAGQGWLAPEFFRCFFRLTVVFPLVAPDLTGLSTDSTPASDPPRSKVGSQFGHAMEKPYAKVRLVQRPAKVEACGVGNHALAYDTVCDSRNLEGLEVIDPTCGTGGFKDQRYASEVQPSRQCSQAGRRRHRSRSPVESTRRPTSTADTLARSTLTLHVQEPLFRGSPCHGH